MTIYQDLTGAVNTIRDTGTNVVTMAASSETGAPEFVSSPKTMVYPLTTHPLTNAESTMSSLGISTLALAAGTALVGWWLWKQYGGRT